MLAQFFMPLPYPIHFAPLQGYTDQAFRNIHHKIFGGVDSYYTPFIRCEKESTIRKKDLRDLEEDSTGKLIPQLIASSPEEFHLVAETIVKAGYTQIDLNMGCPFPILARRSKGAGILPFPDRVVSLLECMEKYPTIGFSVKIRLGWADVSESMQLLPILHNYPLQHITLHPRLGIQQYKGTPDLEGFSRFYEQCKHPLIYNGDIHTTNDILKITEKFPHLAGIMIGRGLLENPMLALEYMQGNTLTATGRSKKLMTFHTELFNYYAARLQGNHQILTKMKSMWEYLLPDADRKQRKHICKSRTLETYQESVSALFRDF